MHIEVETSFDGQAGGVLSDSWKMLVASKPGGTGQWQETGSNLVSSAAVRTLESGMAKLPELFL